MNNKIASSFFLIASVVVLLSACSEPEQSAITTEKIGHSEPIVSTQGDEVKPDLGLAVTGAINPTSAESAAMKPPADESLPPLPIEETGNVEVLPKSYPKSWMIVHEASFFSMFGGKVLVVDVAEEKPAKRIKGMMHASLLANFTQSKNRGEYYILESFHERGSRGKKFDILAIYDKTTLSIKKEIEWPKPNRLQALPERYAMSLSPDEKYLYASNFSPATSFNVVDLDTYKVVAEIGTPGCVLTYPVGKRSVGSLCSNGGYLTTVLNDDGSLKSQHRIGSFFDTYDTPIFEHPVIHNGIAYYPSFHGLLHEFDVSGEVAKYKGSWDMLSAEEKTGNWRPAGLVLNDIDDNGLMYTIFQPDGHEGTQTHGGTQVWVFDLAQKKRVQVIDTPNWAVSIAVSGGDKPLLVVTNGELNLDVFNATTGEFIHTVSDIGTTTPLRIDKSY